MNKELPVIALDYGGPGQFIKQNKNYQLVDPNLPIDKIELWLVRRKIIILFRTHIVF